MRQFFLFILLPFSIWALPNFEESMLLEKHNFYKSILMRTYKEVYENNNYEKTKQENFIIPKIIHQIWIGSLVPKKYLVMMESWKKMHPDWTYILWTNKDIDSFPFINKKLFHEAKNYGLKADIWRLEILYYYGGLYVDTDVECIKPMDILHQSHEFYCGISADVVINAVLGSIPKHPLLKECIQELQKKSVNEQSDPMTSSGPYFITNALINYISKNSNKGICVYPASFFYPFPAKWNYLYWKNQVSMEYVKSFKKEETFSIHYWSTAWKKESFNQEN